MFSTLAPTRIYHVVKTRFQRLPSSNFNLRRYRAVARGLAAAATAELRRGRAALPDWRVGGQGGVRNDDGQRVNEWGAACFFLLDVRSRSLRLLSPTFLH
jgi:hypothetical protein